MSNKRSPYLIIGNSVAAIGGVEGIRSLDADRPVTVVAGEALHTYSRPLISYFLAGQVSREHMLYRPGDFYSVNSVQTQLNTEVVRVDVDQRTVRTKDDRLIGFEKLLIATGGRPYLPKVDGLASNGVFTFTSWADAEAVDAYIREAAARRAVVVGGGLIGIKAAEALHARGLEVLVVELADRLLPTALDPCASELAARAMAEAGVEFAPGTTAERILTENGAVCGIVLKNGRQLACEVVVVAIGVVPNAEIVAGTRVEIDRGIIVDDRCQTSVEDVFAAGDVTQVTEVLSGESRPIPIFPNAHRQGRVAGMNMAGGNARMNDVFAMNSVEVFGLPTISVGLANARGDEYEILVRKNEGRAAYKKLVLRENRIVGALFAGDIDRAGIVTGLIREKVDVSGFKDLLLTDQFGLLSLPAEYRTHVVSGEGAII
jgi:NAD(P)H-nitrite reductase large subunit